MSRLGKLSGHFATMPILGITGSRVGTKYLNLWEILEKPELEMIKGFRWRNKLAHREFLMELKKHER